MKIRVSISLLSILLPLTLSAAEEKGATPSPTPRTFIMQRILRKMGLAKGPTTTTSTGFKGLDIGLKADPSPIKLPEDKNFKVTITLVNLGKKMAQLDFPSSQRIEVLVKAKDGKTIEQWSEDQAFANEPSMVTINPNERLEYVVSLSTRDMNIGEKYSVEAFFPNFEQLRKTMEVAAIAPTPKPTGSPGAKGSPGASPTPAPAPAATSGKGRKER